MFCRQNAEAVAFVDGRLDLGEEEEARIELGEAMELHDSAQEQRGVAFTTLIRRGGDGGEADKALAEAQNVQGGDGLPCTVLKQISRAADMVRILILVGAILIKGLPVLPSIEAESENGPHVLRLHEAQTTHGREALAAVFDRALEHRLRTDPRACLGIIIQAAVDHLGRKVLGMRRDPKPEVMVALVVAVESPGHGYTGGMVTR